jgi:hypothetical protein
VDEFFLLLPLLRLVTRLYSREQSSTRKRRWERENSFPFPLKSVRCHRSPTAAGLYYIDTYAASLSRRRRPRHCKEKRGKLSRERRGEGDAKVMQRRLRRTLGAPPVDSLFVRGGRLVSRSRVRHLRRRRESVPTSRRAGRQGEVD